MAKKKAVELQKTHMEMKKSHKEAPVNEALAALDARGSHAPQGSPAITSSQPEVQQSNAPIFGFGETGGNAIIGSAPKRGGRFFEGWGSFGGGSF